MGSRGSSEPISSDFTAHCAEWQIPSCSDSSGDSYSASRGSFMQSNHLVDHRMCSTISLVTRIGLPSPTIA